MLTFLKKTITLGSIIIATAVTQAYADDALKMDLTANQVIKAADGTISYVPVRTAPSGTVIQYKATYTNTINQDINDLSVTLPIPANMTFNGTAIPTSAQASIDGKNYADMPLMRRVDGKMVKVPLSEYESLRWDIKLLPAKKSAAVSLNTVVD